jgi:hypothetical protein
MEQLKHKYFSRRPATKMTATNDKTALRLQQWFPIILLQVSFLHQPQGLTSSLACICIRNNSEEIYKYMRQSVSLCSVSWRVNTLLSDPPRPPPLFFFYIFVVFLAVLRFSPPLAPHSPLIDPRLLRLHSTMAGRPQRPHHPLVHGPPRVSGYGCFRLRNLPLVSLRGL